MRALTFIKESPEMGRGVYANYDIIAGELIEVAEILVLSKEDTVKVNGTALKHYTFSYNFDQDCLVLGNGEIYNHSDAPNVKYSIETLYGRKVMVFRALCPIKVGEQLFIDYSADAFVDVNEYKAAKSLI